MTCLSHRPLVAELGLSLPDDIQVLPLATHPPAHLSLASRLPLGLEPRQESQVPATYSWPVDYPWGRGRDRLQILEDRSLTWALLPSSPMVGTPEHLSVAEGPGRKGVLLGHLSCWHIPCGDRSYPGPQAPGHCPDLSPRARLIQRGCPDLPMGRAVQGEEPKES